MGLFEWTRSEFKPAGIARGRRRWWGRRGNRAEPTRDFAHDRRMIDVARRGHDHARSAIVACEIGPQAVGRERADRLRRAENRPADRLVGESTRLEQVEHEVIRRVVGGANLLKDDALLACELLGIESGIRQDIRQDVERERNIGAKHARVVPGVLDTRRGVEVSAHGLDFLGDLARGTATRSFECHVFEQMRDAVLVRLLITRPSPHPDSERSRAEMRHAVGDDCQSVRQFLEDRAHASAPAAARLRSSTKRATASALAGSLVIRSRREPRSARRSGSRGCCPMAASTASGNLAG